MIAALAVAAATVAAAPHPHSPAAPGAEVVMPGQRFTPPRTTILLGEEVVWRNQDSARHTVTADERSFDSGTVPPGGEFGHRFDAAGSYRYHCRIHRTMRGTVEVAALALEGPADPVAVGATVVLEGRGPAGFGTVALERAGAVVAHVQPDAEGRFRFEVVADAPATFRARSGGLSSGAVSVPVAPDVRLAARRRGRRHVSVRMHVEPSQAGARMVLERHERERFGYVRMRGVTLDAESRARVVLRTARRLRLRARLAIPRGGYARSASNVVVVPRSGPATSHRGHH